VKLAFDPQFDPMLARAETMTFDRLELRVVTTDDLIAMRTRQVRLRRGRATRYAVVAPVLVELALEQRRPSLCTFYPPHVGSLEHTQEFRRPSPTSTDRLGMQCGCQRRPPDLA
jgi:hypothetical protein